MSATVSAGLFGVTQTQLPAGEVLSAGDLLTLTFRAASDLNSQGSFQDAITAGIQASNTCYLTSSVAVVQGNDNYYYGSCVVDINQNADGYTAAAAMSPLQNLSYGLFGLDSISLIGSAYAAAQNGDVQTVQSLNAEATGAAAGVQAASVTATSAAGTDLSQFGTELNNIGAGLNSALTSIAVIAVVGVIVYFAYETGFFKSLSFKKRKL